MNLKSCFAFCLLTSFCIVGCSKQNDIPIVYDAIDILKLNSQYRSFEKAQYLKNFLEGEFKQKNTSKFLGIDPSDEYILPNHPSDYRFLFKEEKDNVYTDAFVYERFSFFNSSFDSSNTITKEGEDKSVKLTCLFVPLPKSYKSYDIKGEKTSDKELKLTIFDGQYDYGYIFASFWDKVNEDALKEYVKQNIFVA